MRYFVGIDPQPRLISVKVVGYGKNEVIILDWFNCELIMKSSFPTAEAWELYAIGKAQLVISYVHDIIIKHGGKSSKTYCGVEQQMGRVKSILEVALLTCATLKKWVVHAPHPKKWKKSCNMTYGKGNTDNKVVSEQQYKPSLIQYCKSKNIRLPNRIHDLCDAAGIVDHLIYTYSKSK